MEISEKEISDFQHAVQSVSSYDFSEYSDKSFKRRLEKIVSDGNITVKALIDNILRDYNYLERVVRAITVNTTEIFRDPEIWPGIKEMLVDNFADAPAINIWHAGCSSGLEVYSMLILLEELGMLEKSTVYATDINESMLEIASHGKYRYHDISEHLSNFDNALNKTPGQEIIPLSRYMDINRLKNTVQFKTSLIEKPVFIKHDLVTGENIFNTKFHIIMCRNVLIYFNHTLQNKIIDFFSDNLFGNGCLIIGRHEGIIGDPSVLFSKRNSVYYKCRNNN